MLAGDFIQPMSKKSGLPGAIVVSRIVVPRFTRAEKH